MALVSSLFAHLSSRHTFPLAWSSPTAKDTTKPQSTAKQRHNLGICGASAGDVAALLDVDSQFHGLNSDGGGSDSEELEDSDVSTEKRRYQLTELQCDSDEEFLSVPKGEL